MTGFPDPSEDAEIMSRMSVSMNLTWLNIIVEVSGTTNFVSIFLCILQHENIKQWSFLDVCTNI